MDHTCGDCHFLIKQTRDGDRELRFVLTGPERERTKKGDFEWKADHYSLGCAFSVWDEGYAFDSAKRHQIVARHDRRTGCFFWRYREGMLIPAARVLQEREAAEMGAARDRRLAIVGLYIAAGALLVDAYVAAATALKWWPFR